MAQVTYRGVQYDTETRVQQQQQYKCTETKTTCLQRY